MTEALLVSDLTIRAASGAVLVDRASLAVPPGGSLCVIGQTGSGKSLVALAVMGLLPDGLKAEGSICVAGRRFAASDGPGLRRLWHRQTGLVPQEPGRALDLLCRVGRQLGATARGGGRAALGHALAAVDLPSQTLARYPFELSGGMAQRVLVANAQLSEAGLIVADEPTKGLDPDRVGGVIALLQGLVAAGKALLVITHDLAVAQALGQGGGGLAVMQEAAIVESGPAASVLAEPQHPYTRAWIAADPARWPPCPACLRDGDVVLAAHDLGFEHRPEAPLFEGLTLHLRRGEVLAVTGPSGTGKTTLGNVLLGLQRPSCGRVAWRGCDPYRDPAAARRMRRCFQKLHQDPGTVFVPHRPLGLQLLDVVGRGREAEAAARLPALLDRLRLRPALLGRRVGEVSGGEAQRMALARLLLIGPQLIVADEPTSRLDPIVQRETMLLLRELVEEDGLSLILISHHAALVAAVADTCLALGRTTRPWALRPEPAAV